MFKASLQNMINSELKMERASNQLLEIAKTRVERAIEEDEERATPCGYLEERDWMNQQLEWLGIELKTGE